MSNMDFEAVFKEIGEFGKFQKFILFVISISHLLAPSYLYIQVLTVHDTEHHCRAWQDEDCSWLNLTDFECMELKRNLSVPSAGEGTEVDQCHKYNVRNVSLQSAVLASDDWLNSTEDIIDCDEGWVFNMTSRYSSSITIDFELVCGNRYLLNVAQSLFFAGGLTGSFIFGATSDLVGRRRTQLLCYITSAAVGILTAFSASIWMFMFLRFCTAILLRGLYITGFVLINEVVAPSKRVLVGNLLWLFWALGYILFGGLAKFVNNWRILEVFIYLPLIVTFIILWMFVPESPRWLLTKKKLREASKILKKMAKVNGKFVSDDYLNDFCKENENNVSHKALESLKDLINNYIVLFIVGNMCLNWFVQSLVYYGLSLSTSQLGFDPYISFMISGIVEVPAYLLCMFWAELVGRKGATFSTMMLAGVCCSITPFIDPGLARLLVAMAGKFGITMSFSLVYTWSVELVPTSLRSIGLGVFSLTSRIGSVVSPMVLILSDVWLGLPYIIMGLAATIASLLCLLLPETRGKPLPTTIYDTEQLYRKIEQLPEPARDWIESPSKKWDTLQDEEEDEKEMQKLRGGT